MNSPYITKAEDPKVRAAEDRYREAHANLWDALLVVREAERRIVEAAQALANAWGNPRRERHPGSGRQFGNLSTKWVAILDEIATYPRGMSWEEVSAIVQRHIPNQDPHATRDRFHKYKRLYGFVKVQEGQVFIDKEKWTELKRSGGVSSRDTGLPAEDVAEQA